MSRRYFQRAPYGSFVRDQVVFELSHLDEYLLSVEGRQVCVTFEDHCFTRSPQPGEVEDPLYPRRVFCEERYRYSLKLRELLLKATEGSVWIMGNANYAALPTVSADGQPVLYGIFFDLRPVANLPFALHLSVRSAYICETPPATQGDIKFKRLMELRLKGESPRPTTSGHRRTPQIRP